MSLKKMIVSGGLSIFSILKILKNSKFITNVGSIKSEYKDCVILGNGPSLKKSLSEQIGFMEQKELFVVNSFAASEYYSKLKPKFYMLADQIYWNEHLCRERDTVINLIVDKTKWMMYLFVPYFAKKARFFDRLVSKNNNIKLIYFNSIDVSGGNQIINRYLYKYNLAMPLIQNVLIGCIFMAINIGFEKIFLFGADHSWHEDIVLDEKNVMFLKDSYNCFGTSNNLLPFLHPDGKSFRMDDLFLALSNMFKSHLILEDYSKFMGAKIYNASSRSYIDAYERISL